MTKFYRAPWSTLLVVISIFVTVVLLGVSTPIIAMKARQWLGLDLILTLLLIGGAACFGVFGYTVTADSILIHRLFWQTRLPRAGLQSAQFVPNAMRRSLRLFGNGGFFSITGLYRNSALGNYRAFVTDLKRTVVLQFADRTIVLSPENPESFVQSVLAK